DGFSESIVSDVARYEELAKHAQIGRFSPAALAARCPASINLQTSHGPVTFDIHEFVRSLGGVTAARAETEKRIDGYKDQGLDALSEQIRNLNLLLSALSGCG